MNAVPEIRPDIFEIRPQAGPQENFLSTPADIAIYGGAAGGGKSFGLLIDPLRHINNPDFQAVIFRRSVPQILNPGGMWDESNKIYPYLGAHATRLSWHFPEGMRIKFAHMLEERDRFAWQGAQIPWIGFDEVTHFTRDQFFYMLSRLRSVSGVPGKIRATCNPDPDSWVADFIAWFIDQETGFPIPERSGLLRWFIRQGEEFFWANTREELIEQYGSTELPLSVTFIPAKVTDNKILLEKDPSYLANLKAMSRVDRAQLLEGNWKVRPVSGSMFNRSWFQMVDAVPHNIVQSIRYWDRAGTKPTEANPNPDWTVGLKLSRDGNGIFYIEHVERMRGRPLEVERVVVNTASQDTVNVKIGIEKDPGQAGVSEADRYIRILAGYIVQLYGISGDKITRAKPASAQAEAGNVRVVRGDWNLNFFNEIENFPGTSKDDQVDAFSGALNALTSGRSVLDMMTTT